jgi:AAA domain
MALKVEDLQAKMDRAMLNGHDSVSTADRPYELLHLEHFLEARKAPEFVVHGLFETSSVVGVVAPPEAGKSLLMQEVAVCVALGVPFHGRKVKRGLVVYLVGEGQHGLFSRFQALGTRYDFAGDVCPLVVAKSPTSLIDSMEMLRVQLAIQRKEELFKMPLSLLIIDTLARFIAPGDESKAMDMGAYLTAIDTLRGEAAAVTLHHPGHGDGTRGRGSSSWKAGLDTEYSLANAAGVITVTCQKMKDGQKPEPFSFRIESAATKMKREDGSDVTSVLLHSTDYMPVKKPVTGKAQKTLLAAIEAITDGPQVWNEEELRKIGRDAGLHRNSARDAVLGLKQMGYFELTIGGSRLAR